MAKKKAELELMTTYLITHDNGDERKVTVPSDWKVTFGPAAKGMQRGTGPNNLKIPLALRFYEAETKQRVIFTDVSSFRDMSIKTQILKKSVQQKEGFMECDGERKATTFQATTEEWIDPDKPKPLKPTPLIENFDVTFTPEGGKKSDI